MGTCERWGCRAGKGAASWLTWGMHQSPSAAPPHVLDAQVEAEDPSRMGLEQWCCTESKRPGECRGPKHASQASGFKSNGDPPWGSVTGLSIPGCGDRAAGRPGTASHSGHGWAGSWVPGVEATMAFRLRLGPGRLLSVEWIRKCRWERTRPLLPTLRNQARWVAGASMPSWSQLRAGWPWRKARAEGELRAFPGKIVSTLISGVQGRPDCWVALRLSWSSCPLPRCQLRTAGSCQHANWLLCKWEANPCQFQSL